MLKTFRARWLSCLIIAGLVNFGSSRSTEALPKQVQSAKTAVTGKKSSTSGNNAEGSKSAVESWVLEQTTADFGFVVVRVNENVIRLDTDDFHIYIKSPKFDIGVYNPKNKRFLTSSVSPEMIARNQREFHKKYRVLKKEESKIDELQVIHYQTIDLSLHQCVFEFWTAPNMKLPEKMIEAVILYIGCNEMPQGYGMPVRMVRIGAGETPLVYMNTRFAKRKMVPQKMFDTPKGFEEAKNLVDLRADREMQSRRKDAELLLR